ncbi:MULTISPECIES: hypothetical protein [Streptomyces]|uniref:hypothetical protein n=1 Tax=Streptomyces TaxID=1883 RepID=UPI000A1F4B4A|nr:MULTISPECIES: hypothetical protein [Streptomyces]WDO07156.1 hypothetical protein ME763_16595 [Streptomyces murinus]WKE70564.1 hypothetical protein QHG49_16725 [Streptomyces sp. WP-1]
MTTLQLVSLLLALSVCVHVGCVSAFVAWRGGVRPATAFLIGGGSCGTACGLYLAAVSAYR